MRIYLDNCCYNRPFDDQTQERIHLESEAILTILKRGQLNVYEIVGSEMLELEMERMGDETKKRKVKHMHVAYTDEIKKRSEDIMKISKIRTFDSLHIAAAESANADVLLTTDDKMSNMASKLELKVKVQNPLQFAWEVL